MTRLWAWLKSAWAAILVAALAVWWALTERKGRRRAEARADLEADLAASERKRQAEVDKAKAEADTKRAAIETERAAAEVKARVDIQAAERAIEAVREEHRETGTVTDASQRLWDEYKKAGRVP